MCSHHTTSTQSSVTMAGWSVSGWGLARAGLPALDWSVRSYADRWKDAVGQSSQWKRDYVPKSYKAHIKNIWQKLIIDPWDLEQRIRPLPVHILCPWNKKKQTYMPGYDWKCRVLGARAIDAGHRASDTDDTCCRLATWRKYRAWAQRNKCIVVNEVTYEADKNNIWKVIDTLNGSKSVAIASSDSKFSDHFSQLSNG